MRQKDDPAWLQMLLLLLFVFSADALHAESEAPESVELIADGFDLPSNLASPRDGRGRIYVTEQYRGDIRVIAAGRLLPESFLDLRDRVIEDPNYEEGLLGLAFAPDFPRRPYAYVTYISRAGELVLSRFEVAQSGLSAIASSERVLLALPRIERLHHCGHIQFGPKDGLLYLCVGDTQGNLRGPYPIEPVAQAPDRPLGKILRLDVEPRAPVAALQSPSEVAPVRPYKIWATGLRNPWRFAFDPATGDMLIPDVSRYHWDEINFWPASGRSGANFGWPLAEGNECVQRCDTADLVWPIYEYSHRDDRCAVIGGAVYRGAAFPQWRGVFVFGDLCSGEIWALRNANHEPEIYKIATTDLMPHAIGTRFDGEILLADSRAGAVWRLLFPAIDDGGWVPVDRVMLAMVLEARRDGFDRSKEELDRILASRTWRWSRPVAKLYGYISRLFD